MSAARHPLALWLGLGVLALAWGGPLRLALGASFTGHMVMHMAVVAVAAPLLAIGLSGTVLDPARRLRARAAPLLAALLEFALVWGWHAPAAHAAAQAHPGWKALEQGSFLLAGLLVWSGCLGAAAGQGARAAGMVGLLLTSMHMTLLGGLLALAPRPLYDHAGCLWLDALQDQSLGGVVMLLVGGAAYLAGGLWLGARLLEAPADDLAEEAP